MKSSTLGERTERKGRLMLERYGSITRLGWLSATLLLACSGSVVKGVGEVEGGAGKAADAKGETAGSTAIAGGTSAGVGGGDQGPSVEPSNGGSSTSGGSGGAAGARPAGCDETTPPFCVDNDIYVCRSNGSQVLQKGCPIGRHCAVSGDTADCQSNLCAPGTTACIGNQIGTCSTDGASVSPVTHDCAGQGLVCNSANACAENAVDEFGPADKAYTGKTTTLSANVVDVYSDRLLTQIDAKLRLSAATQGAWVVYELVGSEYVLRLDQVVNFPAGDDTYDSGELAFELQAGHRYAFGVYLGAGGCYDSTSPSNDQLSFGKVLGASSSGGGDYHDTSELFPNYAQQFAMHISTAPLP